MSELTKKTLVGRHIAQHDMPEFAHCQSLFTSSESKMKGRISSTRSNTQVFFFPYMMMVMGTPPLAWYSAITCRQVARLTYNTHYTQSKEKSFLFNRTKTKDRTDDDSEVIVPVIPALKKIIDEIAEPYEKDVRLFPFILKEAKTEADCRVRVAQENQNIRKRMAKLAKHLGWKVTPSPTWCRHSFATNLAHQGVPMQYISDAMGHRVGKSVTMSYINIVF